MTTYDIAALKEQHARQTARWNELKARFAALPSRRVRIPTRLLRELEAIASPGSPSPPPPPFGVKG